MRLHPFLIFCAVLCGQSTAHGQNPSYQFENFSINEGLTQSRIRGIVQDTKGFLWIATDDGLNRFDGYSFKPYKHRANDTTSLSDNWIQCIYYDSTNLWIGTTKGLCRYDATQDRFYSKFRVNSISGAAVTAIVSDGKKNIWVGASAPSHVKAGVYYIDSRTQQVKKIEHPKLNFNVWAAYRDSKGLLWFGTDGAGAVAIDPEQRIVLKVIDTSVLTPTRSRVTCIFEDSKGSYWFGTSDGLVRYHPGQTDSLKLFVKGGNEGLLDNNIQAIYEDGAGAIWIGSYGGINILNAGATRFVSLQHDPLQPRSLADNRVTRFFNDRSDNLWLGHHSAGLGKISYNRGFQILSTSGHPSEKLLNDVISAVYQDKPGSLWVLCNGKGINHLMKKNNRYEVAETLEAQSRANWLTHPDVMTLTRTRDGIFWIGSWGKGLFSFDPRTNRFENIPLPENNEVFSILEDTTNSLLVGTNRTGLYHFDRTGKTFRKLLPDPRQPSTRRSTSFANIVKDASGRIFAASYTRGILYQYNKKKETFYEVRIVKADSLGYNEGTNIHSLLIDKSNRFWIGTKDGLAQYEMHPAGDSVYMTLRRVFHQKDGLPNEVINSILEDHHGNLWIGHIHGLSKLDPVTNTLTNFDATDGLPGNEFTLGGTVLAGNELAFGTTQGLIIFNPDSLAFNSHIPPVELTDFKIANRSVAVRKNTAVNDRSEPFTLDAALGYTKEIVLPYDTKVFSIEFATLEFTAPKRNQFRYQLTGFDNAWTEASSDRTATYTNLSSGKYTFHVMASNNNGVWNEHGASINVTLLPPPWKTAWAYSLYGITAIGLFFGAWQQIIRRERLKNEIKLKKIEAEKLQELDSMKSRFFANISHEFRTPLTLILGPLEKYLAANDDSPARQHEFTTMHKNASRLLILVNQLLELSRFEAGTVKLQFTSGDLREFITDVMSEFQSLADSNKIRFEIINSEKALPLYFDRDKLRKTLNNLFSNAFKFTPPGGEVTITIRRGPSQPGFKEGCAVIEVNDTGIGIATRHIDKIFDRFYQVDSSLTRPYEGSGIGLALTKELVQLCHGTISVRSEENHGSVFTVRLPLGSTFTGRDEALTSAPEPELKENSMLEAIKEMDSEEPDLLAKTKPTVLLIEDNGDLRAYIKEALSAAYHVIEAVDGQQGLETAIREVPEIVISDLMMPRKDGLEVCFSLKNDERTSHVPIILLTARAEIESKLQGYRSGADDYMSKPFQMLELQSRIENLLANRNRLRAKYSGNGALRPSDITTESGEDRFVKRAIMAVENHIADSSFGLESFADEVGLSKIQLYRKLNALTPYTPNEFIRHIRLLRASDLLRSHAGPVSEIAYQVGFRNLSYFAKVFKEKFGKTPSEFLKGS